MSCPSHFTWLTYLVDQEYIAEIEGIASYTSRYGLDFNKIFMLNIGYDILSHCTSSFIRDQLGHVYHLSNMEALRDLSINVNLVSNGKVLYTGTTFLCTVGLLTGMNYNDDSFSVSLNYRKVGSDKLGIYGYLLYHSK